jgi:hypothetical protein
VAAYPLHGQARLLRPGKEISLSPEEVKDSFFAYVIGVIGSGVEVELYNSDLREILTEFKTSMDLPFDLISSVSQRRKPSAAFPGLEIWFNASVKIPIPFAVLGYHPGSIIASQALGFTETRPVSDPDDVALADIVYVMRLSRGDILVDVDDWLEWLIPSLVQDLIVELVCIFHSKTEWYCLLAGTGRNTGDRICQFFDFTRNRIVIPIPQEFREFGERIVIAGELAY